METIRAHQLQYYRLISVDKRLTKITFSSDASVFPPCENQCLICLFATFALFQDLDLLTVLSGENKNGKSHRRFKITGRVVTFSTKVDLFLRYQFLFQGTGTFVNPCEEWEQHKDSLNCLHVII